MNLKSIAIILITILASPLILKGDLPKDPVDYRKWESDMLEKIKNLENTPNEEAIPKLGRWVFQLALNTNREAGERPVYQAAKSALMARPSYAEFFGNKIKQITESEISHKGGYHSTERWWQYETLQQLPSPETVKVLGELLFDERGRDDSDDPVQDVNRNLANCRYASRSLAGLIETPPYDPKLHPMSDSALDAWRLWYQQVKAGTRTFRFKDSPVLYGINGPVTEPVGPGGGMDHSSSANNLTGTSEAGSSAGITNSSNPSFWAKWFTAAAGILAVIGAWFAFGKKRKEG